MNQNKRLKRSASEERPLYDIPSGSKDLFYRGFDVFSTREFEAQIIQCANEGYSLFFFFPNPTSPEFFRNYENAKDILVTIQKILHYLVQTHRRFVVAIMESSAEAYSSSSPHREVQIFLKEEEILRLINYKQKTTFRNWGEEYNNYVERMKPEFIAHMESFVKLSGPISCDGFLPRISVILQHTHRKFPEDVLWLQENCPEIKFSLQL
jgi:hypothetical protein